MADAWVELIKMAQSLLAALIGGCLVLLGGWLADRRKNRAEDIARERRQRALLTGMFAVRNDIATRLTEWQDDGLLSRLEPLRTAQAYVHRMIDKTPGESEILMITVIEIGLKLDALLATLDRRSTDPSLKTSQGLAKLVSLQVDELAASLEQFDIITSQELMVLSDDDLAAFPGFSDREAVRDKPNNSPKA